MTDRSDRPLSSEEMLERARREIRERETVMPEDAPPTPAAPTLRATPADAAASRSKRPRPAPPEIRKQPQADPAAQRRAVFLVAIALSLVIAGFVTALVFARAGI